MKLSKFCLQTCAFLLVLLIGTLPVFADEHVVEETPPPTKKYVEFTPVSYTHLTLPTKRIV